MDSGVVDRGVEFVNSFGSALFSVAYQTIDSLDPSPNVTCLNYLRLPWVSQKGSDGALESDDPRCCIFSRSAKDCLASRSCPAPIRLCYLLVSSASCSPWVLSRESISSVSALVIPVRLHFATSSFAQTTGTHSDSVIGTAHDFVTPFSTFANIKGSLPTNLTTFDRLRS